MSNYNSQKLIAELKSQTLQYLNLAEKDFMNLSHEQFAQRPKPGAWSANECLQHLNSYGNYYLPEIEQALQFAMVEDEQKEFKSGWLGAYFTKSMQPKSDGSLASRMNSPKAHIPLGILDTREVIDTFIAQQKRMLALLEKASKVDMNKVRVPISIARFIRLKLGDVFMFIVAHNHRHILQAQRAVNLK